MRAHAIPHAVADNEHPHHQLRIDRGPTDGAVERPEFQAHAGQIKKLIDAAEQVVAWKVIVQTALQLEAVYYSAQVPKNLATLTVLGTVFDRVIFPGVYRSRRDAGFSASRPSG
jgi:hypothetical protein